MSTRYLIAALLMTSSCVAFAQTATPRSAHQITAIRPVALADDIQTTNPQLSGVATDPMAGSGTDVATTLPPAAATDDPVVVSTPVSGVQAAADGSALPEPSSIALMAAGLFGAVGLRRRRNK